MFSDETRNTCRAHGIDIDQSYAALQLEIRMGGPVMQRLTLELVRGLERSNAKREHFKPQTEAATPRKRKTTLSPREKQLLEHLAAGGQVIQFGTSRNTAKSRMKAASRKLSARNKTHAVALAIRQGQIQVPT